jgi:hypothetical protein
LESRVHPPEPLAAVRGNSLGRDEGPPRTRNSSKGALLVEGRAVFRAMTDSMTLASVREECFEGGLLRQSAIETRRRIWEALHWRFFAWDPPKWVLHDLRVAACSEQDPSLFHGLAYLHYARRDRMTFDFVTEYLWDRWKSHQLDLRRADAADFLSDYEARRTGQRRWRESTRDKVSGNLLSALRDFGVLAGTLKKEVRRPAVAQAVVLHHSRLLAAEGLRGRGLLNAPDWRLFLWTADDVSDAFTKLSQAGDFRFERSGSTVVLHVPPHHLAETP